MRHLIYLPFLAFLMGSDCDGGSEEPVDTAPPVNTLEVQLAGTQTTIASGDAPLTIEWNAVDALAFTGFADDAGGLSQAWLTATGVDFVAGTPSATGTGTGLTVTGTPGLPASSPSSFTVELHSRAADGAETHGPQVIVDVVGCVGSTVLTAADCTASEGGYYCDLTGDVCYGSGFGDVANTGSTAVELSPSATTSQPFLSLQPGESSSAWSGSTMRGIGVSTTGADFELTISWL